VGVLRLGAFGMVAPPYGFVPPSSS
jgi:hypothetical protein